MTPTQARLVQDSFASVAPIAPQIADLFYARLFDIAPQVRPLFKSDMAGQKRKLMKMLGTIIAHLHRPEAISDEVRALARRHVAYGAVVTHYDLIGEALIWTIGRSLGPDFDTDTRAAWQAAYATLSGIMIDAVR